MDLFDLHCDTLSKCLESNGSLYDGEFDFDIVKTRIYNKRCQTFAAFIPDEYRGEAAFEYYKRLRNCLYDQLEKYSDYMSLCRSSNEIEKTVSDGKLAALFSVENATALGGKIENIETLYNDGVRIMSLTWNDDNELAGGIRGSGMGLTELGKKAVCEINRLGIIIDVSHLSDRGFDDVYEMGIAPIIATHSNLRSINENKRNLTDRQFLKIVETGGVAGINFYTDFLGERPFESAFSHIYRMLSLGGEDNIAIGSDFDGADFDEKLNSVEKVYNLAEYLSSMGLSDSVIEKIMFNNALRVLGVMKK
ncbi:MAG: dipeptidase [Clostridia bacterium]|nr:dipeptidase [Clostridia bacterium]